MNDLPKARQRAVQARERAAAAVARAEEIQRQLLASRREPAHAEKAARAAERSED
jgi:hypothetical protein